MVTIEKLCSNLHGLKPILLMVAVQIVFTGMNILLKLAANDGMNLRVLVAYRFMFGAAFIVPLAFFLERKKRPKLTWTVIFQAFLAGLFGGALGQNVFLEGLVLTSATFAAAMTNLIPAFTFIVGVCLRLENLGWNTKAGNAKVIGTLLGIGGAMLFTFYKGPEIIIWKTSINLLNSTHHHSAQRSEDVNLVLGIILALISCVSYSLWLIVQAKAAERYPCPQSFTALMTFMAAIQSLSFAICMERDWSKWTLGWNIRLLTVAYSGILGSGLIFTLVALCVRMRGPLFVSMFNPLLLILVAIAGSLLLDEKLHLGNLLGAILIICALYFVLWGKGKEIKRISQLVPQNNAGDEENQVRQIEVNVASSIENDGSSNRKDEERKDCK